MLTYDLNDKKIPLYKNLYEKIRNDINAGVLKDGEKMPSKRTLANNLGVSTITVEKAYDQLIGEGYLYTLPQKGYYISRIERIKPVQAPAEKDGNYIRKEKKEEVRFDFSSNRIESKCFPFSVWAKLIRETISLREEELLTVSPCNGVAELRVAIAKHLGDFRGMSVNPEQIVVGAGTEYLYHLLIRLLGEKKRYSIETPGYIKLKRIYESNHADCRTVGMDEKGIRIDELEESEADIAHISPTHHFPTGITMPVSRRYELLAWANEKEGRYIIEDDYDSEFRINGNPIPALQSIDAFGKVIYMNTFSKSLASTIRISYMVLPERLADLYYERMSFYSCTVSTFEQYTLAAFINRGYFEKHINRMRLYYGRKRKKVLDIIRKTFRPEQCRIIENGSGLHFLIELQTKRSDSDIIRMLAEEKIKICSLNDFEMGKEDSDRHMFLINYSNIDVENFGEAVRKLRDIAMN